MANPDITAITELNAGTLAFTLKTDQVTYLSATQEDAVIYNAYSYDIPFELDDAADGKLSKHATFKDEFMLAYMVIGDGFEGTPAVTWQGTGGNEYFTALPDTLLGDAEGGNVDGKMFYIKNPTLNAGDIYALFNSSNNNEQGSCAVQAFSHVDQTNPFKTQPWFDHAGKSGESDHAIWKGTSDGKRLSFAVGWSGESGPKTNRDLNNAGYGYGRKYLRYDEANINLPNMSSNTPYLAYGMFPMEMNPGDLMVGNFLPQNNGRYPEPVNVQFLGGSKNAGGDWRNAFPFISPYEGPAAKYPMFHNRFGQGMDTAETKGVCWYTVLQSPQTKTTLFAGVADYVIKLNQIYITNPEVNGTMVDIDITGLTGSGTNFTTSGGATVVTVTGDSSTQPTDFSVCKGKFAQRHKPIPVLDRPIYLPATAGLKAKATHGNPHIEFLDRTVDIVVDFEVIGDA